MREIKFRAWHSKYGYSSPFGIGGHPEWNDGMTVSYFSSVCQFEQFTGLHDKNGKEIYEGDVRRGGYVVKYLPNKASFMWTSQKTKDTVFIRSICGEDEIIGNIHENPELLEVTK